MLADDAFRCFLAECVAVVGFVPSIRSHRFAVSRKVFRHWTKGDVVRLSSPVDLLQVIVPILYQAIAPDCSRVC